MGPEPRRGRPPRSGRTRWPGRSSHTRPAWGLGRWLAALTRCRVMILALRPGAWTTSARTDRGPGDPGESGRGPGGPGERGREWRGPGDGGRGLRCPGDGGRDREALGKVAGGRGAARRGRKRVLERRQAMSLLACAAVAAVGTLVAVNRATTPPPPPASQARPGAPRAAHAQGGQGAPSPSGQPAVAPATRPTAQPTAQGRLSPPCRRPAWVGRRRRQRSRRDS